MSQNIQCSALGNLWDAEENFAFPALSRLMRTVKDTISPGDYVFLLNTASLTDMSFRAPNLTWLKLFKI